MCLHPVSIRSRSLVPHVGMYQSLSVPCGHCAECENSKRSSILIRAYYEHKASCYTFFDTLTYDDEHLPTLCDYALFSRKDVQKFLKRLRIACQRFLFSRYGVECKSPFTFLVTSEYGGLRGRPHYHILFHVKDGRLGVYDLKKLINKTWKNGFTDSIYKTSEHVVNSVAALQYVVKYVVKDSVSNERLSLAIDAALKDKSFVCPENEKRFVHDLKRDYGPFWQSSLQYGMSLLNEIDYNDLIQSRCKWFDNKNLSHYVSLPTYYVNKVFRSFVSHGDSKITLTNKFGRECLLNTLVSRIGHTSLVFRDALANLGLPTDFADTLSVYQHVYRGRLFESVPDNPFDVDTWQYYAKLSCFTKNKYDFYIKHPERFLKLRPVRFDDYERLLERVEHYLYSDSESVQTDYDFKDVVTQRLKQLKI